MVEKLHLGIVGTAGRKEDGPRLTQKIYKEFMIESAKQLITKLLESRPIDHLVLVSGGAAWTDHIAVSLFLRGNLPIPVSLELYLPCAFGKQGFVDNGIQNYRQNPGGVANHYHRMFSKKVYKDSEHSLEMIGECLNSNECFYEIGNGFFERNKRVAERSTHILAYTFGNGALVKDGGTHNTVSHFRKSKDPNKSFHCDLNTFEMHSPAEVEEYAAKDFTF